MTQTHSTCATAKLACFRLPQQSYGSPSTRPVEQSLQRGSYPNDAASKDATLIDTTTLAKELALHLLDPHRQQPVALVTRPRGLDRAWINVDHVTNSLIGLVEVYEMPTGPVSWAFSDALADFPGTECYGGAGRVYPAGLEWTTNLNRSPLRLAYSENEGDRATSLLIKDASQSAASICYSTSSATPGNQAPTVTNGQSATKHITESDWVDAQREVARLRTENESLVREVHLQQQRARSALSSQNRAEKRLTAVQAALEKHEADQRAFTDPERQFRYEVELAWARRIPAAEKAAVPLVDYEIGPEFLSTLQPQDRSKAVNVVLEVITGRADTLPGRAAHHFRSGHGAEESAHRREDGSTLWRVSLQHNSPQARRLHFWRGSNGQVELASVRSHDDMRP